MSRVSKLWERFRSMLASHVDGGSLAALRIAFGLILAVKTYKWLRPLDGRSWREALESGTFNNWIEVVFTGPHVHWLFPYHGFEWVRPLPEPWTTIVALAMGIGGLLVALGLFYRVAIVVVGLAWTYFFLLDETHYNNHYYLVSLLALILAISPAHRRYSLDRLLWHRRATSGPWSRGSVPFWCIFLLRLQLFVVYFYGGVAKFSRQWMLDAEPVFSQLQLPRVQHTIRSLLEIVGRPEWFDFFTSKTMALAISHLGLVFDLFVVPALLWRRTRYFALVAGWFFHATNHFILFDDIGLFPHLGAATLLIFFEPDWPRRLVMWLRRPRWRLPDWRWSLAGLLLAPPLGILLGWKSRPSEWVEKRPAGSLPGIVTALVVVWTATQLLLPLRHYFITGDVSWTAEGERWSWRMKAGLKHLVPPRIRVVDRHILPTNDHIEWSQWHGQPVVYREVDLARLDWKSMPRYVVFFQPFYGQRLIYNPWSTSASSNLHSASEHTQPTFAAAALTVMNDWKAHQTTTPKLYQTQELSLVLAAAQRRLAQLQANPPLQQAVAEARAIADQMRELSLKEIISRNLRAQLHDRLATLADNPTHSEWFRTLLARVHPFALNGVSGGPWFLGIESPRVVRFGPTGLVIIDQSALPFLASNPHCIYIDSDRFTPDEWEAFPRLLVHQQTDGSYELLWNLYADLLPLQARVMQGRPFMCHQYARRIASWWQTEYGRWPEVYFTSYVGLAPARPQLAIDPTVDLASTPLNLWGHNDWIMPWRGRQTASTAP